MFNKYKRPHPNEQPEIAEELAVSFESNENSSLTFPTPIEPPLLRNNMMDIISSNSSKPSILSEGFSFRGELSAKGAIHVEGSLNGQIQVDDLTIGSKGQVEGVVTCSSLHIKGKFSGTATCSELIVTSSAAVDGHVVYQTLSVQKGASIKGELLLVK